MESLKRSDVKRLIDDRMKEFRENRNKPINEIFKELCFCILAANFKAERAVKMQVEINDGFLNMSEHELAEKIKALGHRHPSLKAKYIVEARKHIPQLEVLLKKSVDEKVLREWLVNNVGGVGYKVASHFLRNIGYTSISIIDRHILSILSEYGLIKKPKTLTKLKYLEIESLLNNIARIVNLPPGELDLYLWFIKTGKVIK
ncbi:MAG: N-glycosylase/DNA lyase [Candidatus Bathyarchaeia archaeon]